MAEKCVCVEGEKKSSFLYACVSCNLRTFCTQTIIFAIGKSEYRRGGGKSFESISFDIEHAVATKCRPA